MGIVDYLAKPFCLQKIQKYLSLNAFVLDVGCGNHSPSGFKKYFPEIEYFGVDKDLSYNLNEEDVAFMKKFFQINLDNLNDMDVLPDNYFDCIVMAHVLEHLQRPYDIVKSLTKKLKKGGVLFLEYPGQRSLSLPRMTPPVFQSTLNFYDDNTHIAVPSTSKIVSILNGSSCRVLEYGTRRLWKKILLFPLYLMSSIYRFRKIDGAVFWDLLGFADYVLSVKE